MSIKVSPEAFLAAYSDYIVIVGITEADIQDLDHYPISDRLLAQVLSQILAFNPVMVGLGLFRDVPVNYGETRRDVPVERLTMERLLVDKSETLIVGADLATIVGAGLGTKFRYSPITYQQNPPSPPITYQQNPPSPPITYQQNPPSPPITYQQNPPSPPITFR